MPAVPLKRPDLPLVTVVTPSYNQGRFIRATIESVLSQRYPNVEYIVLDALSNDETAAVCADYADRLLLGTGLEAAHAVLIAGKQLDLPAELSGLAHALQAGWLAEDPA